MATGEFSRPSFLPQPGVVPAKIYLFRTLRLDVFRSDQNLCQSGVRIYSDGSFILAGFFLASERTGMYDMS